MSHLNDHSMSALVQDWNDAKPLLVLGGQYRCRRDHHDCDNLLLHVHATHPNQLGSIDANPTACRCPF